jgi:hypothetical protein
VPEMPERARGFAIGVPALTKVGARSGRSAPRLRRSCLGYDVTRGDRRRIGKHLGKVLVHP